MTPQLITYWNQQFPEHIKESTVHQARLNSTSHPNYVNEWNMGNRKTLKIQRLY